MKARPKSQGMVAGEWFALLRTPDGLPVVFASKTDAEDNLDFDEYLVKVHIRPCSTLDILRGEQVLIERKERKAAETASKKTGIVVDFKGAAGLRQALKKMAPLMRQRFVDAMNAELSAIRPYLPKKKGGRRARRK